MRSSTMLLAVALVCGCASAELAPSSSTAPTATVRTGEPAASAARTASPTAAPRILTETQAWAELRSALPGVPIVTPTWLPNSVDRTRVELRVVATDPADPRYAMAYVAPNGAAIVIALGPVPDVAGSALGTRVRNSAAVLSFPSDLWSDPGKTAPRRLRWTEGRFVLRIESERFSSEDVLHVGWSLDRSGAPAPKNPYARVKPGVCAVRGAAADETVRRLIGFIGAGDRDAVMDCFSLELLGDYPGYGGWADLPRASDAMVIIRGETGGRVVVSGGWKFASDPGGAWGQQAHQFFVLGLEDGSWRVYETATAWYASLP